MTFRNRHFLQGGLLALLGIALFIALFYGLRAALLEGRSEEAANMIAFGVGLATFIVCTMFGAFRVTVGLIKSPDEA